MASEHRWLAVCLLWCMYDVTSSRGTTPNIRDIFIGRCYEYLEIGMGRTLVPEPKDCHAIWNAFVGAWAFKNPSEVTQADYQQFFNLTGHSDVPVNKTLLWSGTFHISHVLNDGGGRYVTLEDTLTGYLANGLTWCGMKCDSCTGINYQVCPDWWTLPTAARHSFWGGASTTFAKSAKGLVTIVLTGSIPDRPAYRPDSALAKFELPGLSKNVSIRIVLLTDLEKPPLETCNTGSLVSMRTVVESRGFVYRCEHNPEDVLHLMCVDHLQDGKCSLPFRQPITGGDKTTTTNQLRTVLSIPTTKIPGQVVG